MFETCKIKFLILIRKYQKRNCNKTCIAQKVPENNAVCIEIPALVITIPLFQPLSGQNLGPLPGTRQFLGHTHTRTVLLSYRNLTWNRLLFAVIISDFQSINHTVQLYTGAVVRSIFKRTISMDERTNEYRYTFTGNRIMLQGRVRLVIIFLLGPFSCLSLYPSGYFLPVICCFQSRRTDTTVYAVQYNITHSFVRDPCVKKACPFLFVIFYSLRFGTCHLLFSVPSNEHNNVHYTILLRTRSSGIRAQKTCLFFFFYGHSSIPGIQVTG